MKIGKFRELVGSSDHDRLIVQNNQISYGLTGDDGLFATSDSLLGTRSTSMLVGGFGSDFYVAAKQGLTVVLDRGNALDENGYVEDIVTAGGIGLTRKTSFVLSIDKRHLLAGDTKSGQFAILIDWKKSRNKIETFSLSDGAYSYSDIAKNYKKFPGYLGNYSWKQLEKQGLLDLKRVGFTPASVNRNIQAVVNRIDQLQGSFYSPPDIFSSSSSNQLG